VKAFSPDLWNGEEVGLTDIPLSLRVYELTGNLYKEGNIMSDEKKNFQMTPAICTQCGASVEVDPKQEAAVCEYCRTPFIIDKAIKSYNLQNATVSHVDSINIIKTGAVESVLNFADKQITRIAEEEKVQRVKSSAFVKKYWWVYIAALVVLFSMLFFVAADESKDSAGKIRVNVASSDLVGKNYEDVVTNLKNAGFTNVETEVIDDLVTGWLTKDGEVDKVEIDGTTSFSSDSKFEPSAKIVVAYHTFPEQTVSTTTEDQKIVTDNTSATLTTKAESESVAISTELESVYDFAYIVSFKDYALYYLIDTDEKVVKYFQTNDTGVLAGTYTGDLDNGIDISYSGGDLHQLMRYQNVYDDSSIIVTDPNGYEFTCLKTSVSEAEKILNQDGYKEITSY